MQAYHKKGSISARVAALDFLRTVCTKDADGFAVYNEGWSDWKVAKHLKHSIHQSIVSQLRREHIGRSRAHHDRWMASSANRAAQAPAQPTASTAPQAIASEAALPTSEVNVRLSIIETKIDAIIHAFQITV